MFGFTPFSQSSFSDDGVVNLSVSVTGVEGTGEVGTATAKNVITVNVTGLESTGNVGTSVATGGSNTPQTGIEATGEVMTGSPTIVGDANVSVTGVEATGEVGIAEAKIVAFVQVTGVEGTGEVGDATVGAGAVVSPTGVEGAGNVGSIASVIGDANVFPTGVSANAFVGPEIVFSGVGDAQISTAQYKFGGASLLLDGTGDSVVSDGTYNFGGDPFTVDMWVRPTSGTQDGIFFDSRDSTSNDTIALRQSSDNLLVLRGNATLFNINAVFSVDTWVHIAVTRGDPFGNTYSVFVDGVKQDSTLFGVTATAADIHIGSDFNGSNNWEGYIDELRVSTVDQYDGSDFTPETSAYTSSANSPVLLHFDGTNGSTDFVNSGSVDAVTITGDANLSVTGVSGTGEVGSVVATGGAYVPATGLEATGNVGSVTVTGGTGIIVNVTGLEATGAVGNVTVKISANVFPTGVSGTGEVTSPVVWGRIVPNPGTSWSDIEPSSSTVWTEIAA